MNIRILKMEGISVQAEELLTFQVKLRFAEIMN